MAVIVACKSCRVTGTVLNSATGCSWWAKYHAPPPASTTSSPRISNHFGIGNGPLGYGGPRGDLRTGR